MALKINICLDGVWETEAAYDGELGDGDLTLGETARNLRRWNETDLTKQEDIIDEEMA